MKRLKKYTGPLVKKTACHFLGSGRGSVHHAYAPYATSNKKQATTKETRNRRRETGRNTPRCFSFSGSGENFSVPCFIIHDLFCVSCISLVTRSLFLNNYYTIFSMIQKCATSGVAHFLFRVSCLLSHAPYLLLAPRLVLQSLAFSCVV